MKAIYIVFVGLAVAVGCGGAKKETNTATCFWCKEEIKLAALVCKHCGKKPNPTLQDKVVGVYEFGPMMLPVNPSNPQSEKQEYTYTHIFQAGGQYSTLENGEDITAQGARWYLVGSEVHVKHGASFTQITELMPNGNMRYVAEVDYDNGQPQRQSVTNPENIWRRISPAK